MLTNIRLIESNRIISSRKGFTTEFMAKYLFVNINAEFDKAIQGNAFRKAAPRSLDRK